jgi:hypothetical protein
MEQRKYALERRYLDRFEVPDAQVVSYSNGSLTSTGTLADITKISARFEISHRVNIGDLLDLEIIIPEKGSIFIKGQVVRIVLSGTNSPPSVAVQFFPFGTDQRYNSMASYQQLNELTSEYSNSPA